MKKLNLESEFKNIITEQTDIKTSLQKSLENGCINNGKIVELRTTNPNRKYAIKKESKKTPGTFIYFFADGSYGSFDKDGVKFTNAEDQWECATSPSTNPITPKTT